MKRFLNLFHYLKPVALPFALGIGLGIIYGVSSGFGFPVILHYIFPKVFDKSNEVPLYEVILYCSLLPFLFLIRGTSNFFSTLLITYTGTRVLESIRLDVFRKLQTLELAFFSRNKAGDLLSRVLGDTAVLQTMLVDFASNMIKKPATLLSALGSLVYLSLKHSEVIFILFCLISVPFCILVIRKVGKRLLRRTKEMLQITGEAASLITENLLAAKEIRAFCLQNRQLKRLRELIRKVMKLQIKRALYAKGLSPLIEFISAIGISVIFFLGYQKGISLDIFMPLVGALYMSYEPIKGLGTMHTQLKQGQASLERLDYILKAPVTVKEPLHPVTVERIKGEVQFERVVFSYEKEPALREVSFSTRSGETVALVGASGAGKTTIANLLLRFYNVDSGRITIDSIDLKDFLKANLRRHIALVPQEPFLLNDTIYNNILYGDLTASAQRVYAAAKNAYAHSFIQQQPNGYQTYVGERGYSISGGQRQRIALARAFLRDAPILILDEATSALDAGSEAMIQKALERLIYNRTVFIIAHRFSMIRFADRILVLDAGRLVAQGPHDTLYGTCPLYKKIYDTQAMKTEKG